MNERTWRLVRWPVMVAALLVVVVVATTSLFRAVGDIVTLGEDEQAAAEVDEPEPTEPAVPGPTGPLTDGEALAVADVDAPAGIVGDPEASSLILTDDPGDSALLTFELLQGSVTCLEVLQLEMSLTQLRGVPEEGAEIAVYPAAVADVRDLSAGQPLPSPPGATEQVVALARAMGEGRLQWDVTPLYRDWLTSGRQPEGTPFTMAVQATIPASSLVFAASGSSRAEPPALRWTAVPGCTGA